jgi:hypothetical protein
MEWLGDRGLPAVVDDKDSEIAVPPLNEKSDGKVKMELSPDGASGPMAADLRIWSPTTVKPLAEIARFRSASRDPNITPGDVVPFELC